MQDKTTIQELKINPLKGWTVPNVGITLTNQNSIQDVIKSSLKLRNAFFHSMQNLSSFSLLYENIKM